VTEAEIDVENVEKGTTKETLKGWINIARELTKQVDEMKRIKS